MSHLPVVQSRRLFLETNALLANGVFTSEVYDVSQYAASIFALKASADGTFVVQYSVNGEDWDSTLSYTYTVGETFVPHVLQNARSYMRVVYTNGSVAQTYFRFEVMVGLRTALTSKLDSVVEPQADAAIVRSISEEHMIAAGLYSGWSITNKFGQNATVDGEEDVWGGGGLYTGFPTSGAQTVEVSSSDAQDAYGSGTGAWTLRVEGLDENGLRVDPIDVNLDGTNWVEIPTQLWTRNYRQKVVAVGSGGKNVGVITVRWTGTTSVVFSKMQPGTNQSQIAAYTVAADEVGLLKYVYASITREAGGTLDREAKMALMIGENGILRQVNAHNVSNQNDWSRQIYGGIVCPAGTDIVMRVLSVTTGNTHVSSGFDILSRKI